MPSWRIVFLLLLGLSGFSVPVSGQTIRYQGRLEPHNYLPLTSTATVVQPGLAQQGTFALQLPFSVGFYGQSFDRIYINANGWLSVLPSRGNTNFPPTSVPQAGGVDGYIAGLWADWCASVDGCPAPVWPQTGIYYQIDGAVGQRRLIVEFRSLRHFLDGRTASNINYQIHLYEGLGSQIEIHYGPMEPGTDLFGQEVLIGGRIGLESPDAHQGQWLLCSGALPCSNQTIRALQDHRLRLLADGGIDLKLDSLSVPQRAYPGLQLPVALEVRNYHRLPLGPFSATLYLSEATATSTLGAARLQQTAPAVLTAFERRILRFSTDLPLDTPLGNYRIWAWIDSEREVFELDESNNLLTSSGILEVAQGAPDFEAVELSTDTGTASWGQKMTWSFALENSGNQAAQVDLAFYLSKNRVVSSADHRLSEAQQLILGPRERYLGQIEVELPSALASGRYYPGYIADADLRIRELSESNNAVAAARRLLVLGNTLALLTDSLPRAGLEQEYEVDLQAVGGDGNYQFSIDSGTLPPGLTLSAGKIFGVPLVVGNYRFAIKVQSRGQEQSRNYQLQVEEFDYPLQLLTTQFPKQIQGQEAVLVLEAAGGQPPYLFSIAEGRLNPGLQLDELGIIYGIPQRPGQEQFKVRLRDGRGEQRSRSLRLQVAAPGNFTLEADPLPIAFLGESYRTALKASGGQGALRWKALTILPAGLSLADDGLLNGIPEKVGRYSFWVSAQDEQGAEDSQQFHLQVQSQHALNIYPRKLPLAELSEPYSGDLMVAGAEGAVRWSIEPPWGLPPGIRTSTAGQQLRFRGQIEEAGAWAFTVKVQDRTERVDEYPFAIVSQALSGSASGGKSQGCHCRHTDPPAIFFEGNLLLLGMWLCWARVRRKNRR